MAFGARRTCAASWALFFDSCGGTERSDGVHTECRADRACTDTSIVRVAATKVTLDGDLSGGWVQRGEAFLTTRRGGQKVQQVEPKALLLFGDRVHADVAVGTTLRAGAAADAVLVDDLDFTAGHAHDAVDAAQ